MHDVQKDPVEKLRVPLKHAPTRVGISQAGVANENMFRGHALATPDPALQILEFSPALPRKTYEFGD